VDVLVSCAATGDSCHTFIIFLFALVKTFKHEYTTKRIHVAGNISIHVSVTFFPSLIGLHVISSYDLLTLYGTPSSDFHILSTPPVILKNETWCEKSHLCLRIAVSAYLNVGPFRLIRVPIVLTPVPIGGRACLRVE